MTMEHNGKVLSDAGTSDRTRRPDNSAWRAALHCGAPCNHFSTESGTFQAEVDLFREVRERVSARSAAEHYGFQPNRAGFICCPFHDEKSPSLKLYGNGSFHCFGCGVGGSSIDFTMKLFGLTPLEAVKRLDTDFSLHLGTGTPLTGEKFTEARKMAEKRKTISAVYTAFETWRERLLNRLCQCVRLANMVEQFTTDPGELSDVAALALREREHADYLALVLSDGSAEEQALIWRERWNVERWLNQILSE